MEPKTLDIISNKIIDKTNLDRILAYWKFRDKKIVFTNGCFDILHRGHIDYLSKASDLGDILVIGLNSDQSVKTIKGPERPVQDEQTRALILASLSFVDAVILFDEPTPQHLIDTIIPNVLVKGSDYAPEEIVGYETVVKNGGKVVTIDYLEGHSSTSIINKLFS